MNDQAVAIRREVTVPGTPESAFRAFTNGIGRWWPLAWESPGRLVLAWEIAADWSHDPGLATQVEVRFTASGKGFTRVVLEHRGLEAYGERTDEMRGTFESPGGWPGLLERYAARAGEEA